MSADKDKPLRGFGFTLDLGPKGIGARSWYVGPDGIQRWTHSDEPVNYELTEKGRAVVDEYKRRKDGK